MELANRRSLSLLVWRGGLDASFLLFLLEVIEASIRVAPHLIGCRLCHRLGFMAGAGGQHEHSCQTENDASGSFHIGSLKQHTCSLLPDYIS